MRLIRVNLVLRKLCFLVFGVGGGDGDGGELDWIGLVLGGGRLGMGMRMDA